MIHHNQKGVTLLEVLLSIVILTIILVTIMNFFPQMAGMNKHNEDKQQAINLAKKELIDWQGRKDIKEVLANPSTVDTELTTLSDYVKKDNTYYYFKGTSNDHEFDVEVKIEQTSNILTTPLQANAIHVILRNSHGIEVSKTYGYITYELGGVQ